MTIVEGLEIAEQEHIYTKNPKLARVHSSLIHINHFEISTKEPYDSSNFTHMGGGEE